LVAAGVGLLYVPQSLARLHHRKDLTYRPVTDAPQSSVALSWPQDATTDLVEDFIGIVRGRTVNSTRGRRPQPEAGKAESTASRRAGGKGGARKTGGKTSTGRGGGKATGRTGGAKGRGGAPRSG